MPTDFREPLSVDQWLLRCRECGATVEVSIADATEYAYTKWPRCCGQVMDLCAKVAQPVRWRPTAGDLGSALSPSATGRWN